MSSQTLISSANSQSLLPVKIINEDSEKKQLLIDKRVLRIKNKLGLCGDFYYKDFYCSKCRSSEHENKVGESKVMCYNCSLKICSRPECKSASWGKQYTKLKDTWRLTGNYKKIKELYHMTIGFDKIYMHEWKNKTREQRKLINLFFKLLNKEINPATGTNYDVQAVAIHDVSRGSRDLSPDGKVYSHFHFGIIPIKGMKTDIFLRACHKVRRQIHKKKKLPLGLKFEGFGFRTLERVLSYFSLRSTGLYKPYETPEIVDYTSKALIEGIKNKEFMLLADLMSIEKYAVTSYNSKNIWTIGKEIKLGNLLKSNIVTNDITDEQEKQTFICPIHGFLERKEVFPKMVFQPKPPPPPYIEIKTIYNEIILVDTKKFSPNSFGGGL